MLFLSSHTIYLAYVQVHHADLPFRGIPRRKQLVNDIDARKSFDMSNLLNLSLPSSGSKFLKLKWRKFDHLASEVGGARNIFCTLWRSQGCKHLLARQFLHRKGLLLLNVLPVLLCSPFFFIRIVILRFFSWITAATSHEVTCNMRPSVQPR